MNKLIFSSLLFLVCNTFSLEEADGVVPQLTKEQEQKNLLAQFKELEAEKNELLRQEARLMDLLRKHNLPIPAAANPNL